MFDNGAGPKPRQDRYQLPSLTSSNMKPITAEAERERVNSNSLCTRRQLTCGITNQYLSLICINNYTYMDFQHASGRYSLMKPTLVSVTKKYLPCQRAST